MVVLSLSYDCHIIDAMQNMEVSRSFVVLKLGANHTRASARMAARPMLLGFEDKFI